MKGVVFDIGGKFAHFRKVYTNSSSLSYSVPPRTTISGLLAAMLGLERDSYYDRFNSQHLHIAVRKNGPTYSITQTLNYIKAVSTGELIKPKEHTQIPFEIITAVEKVSYRIYAAFDDEGITTELQRRLRANRFVYPPTLGTAFFSADIDYVDEADFAEEISAESIALSSIVNASFIKNLALGEFSILKEKMPRDFADNRAVLPMEAYLVEANGRSLTVKMQSDLNYWNVQYKSHFPQECIVFM